jgi:hypothetical protein
MGNVFIGACIIIAAFILEDGLTKIANSLYNFSNRFENDK